MQATAALIVVLSCLTNVAVAQSSKLAGVRVNPLSRAPRVAPASGTRSAATDPHAAALAARLHQQVAAIRAGRAGSAASATDATTDQILADFRRRVGTAVEVHFRPRVGTPTQIRGAILEWAGPGGAAASGAGDEATARRFFATNRELLRLDDPDHELVLRRRDTDHINRRHLRFAQTYHGLPVWPADMNVHLDAAGNVDLMEGAFVPTPRNVRLSPRLDGAAAIDRARAVVPGGAAAAASVPALIVFAPGTAPPHLAWKLDLTVSLTARWLVVVDAIRGRILTAFNQVETQAVPGSGDDLLGVNRSISVFRHTDGEYYMVDTSKAMFDPTSEPPYLDRTRGGIIILDAFNEPPTSKPDSIPDLYYVTAASPNAWSPADAVSAAFSLSRTYDYYRTQHGRNSLDGQGGSLIAVVRLGQNFFNAFWNGSMMVFGDAEPMAGSIDVVAHELTHGVTEYTANLIYLNQSGAMNEAFSDIFGEMVEAYTLGENDWVLGSALPHPFRNMSKPWEFDDPATMSDFLYTDRDNGGVHTNSGIINYAFYLLAEGLDDAIGRGEAERIFYRALTLHLFANAQFIDCRLACIASAEELFGPGSRQTLVTAEAFDTVEIYHGRGTPQPPTFPPVTGVDATLSLYWDPAAESYFLDRREESLGDLEDGVRLVDAAVGAAKPAVTGDGSFAAYVDAYHDICFLYTDGSPIDPESGTIETCLGLDFISSAGMAPDGNHYGFVLLDGSGNPDNKIRVIEISGEEPITRTFVLQSPTEDAGLVDSVLRADTMDLTADNRFLIYDALNQMRLANGSEVEAWSIYAIDLDSENTLAIVPPIPGMEISFPSLSQTSDNFIVFDAYDDAAEQSTVMTANLTTGDRKVIATVQGGYGVPGYVGDDSAIVYSQADDDTPTEFSLYRQPLADDRLEPRGAPALWMRDADYSVIYRRGTFTGPPTPTPTRPTSTPTRTHTRGPTPTPGPCYGDCNRSGSVTIDELIRGVSIALGNVTLSQCPRFDTNNDGAVRINELVAAVNAALNGCRDR